MKLVINSDYGGFSLSGAAVKWLMSKGMTNEQTWELEEHENRANKLLVECVETLGKSANGSCASLRVVEIEEQPYYIREYDGAESVVIGSDFVIPKYNFE